MYENSFPFFFGWGGDPDQGVFQMHILYKTHYKKKKNSADAGETKGPETRKTRTLFEASLFVVSFRFRSLEFFFCLFCNMCHSHQLAQWRSQKYFSGGVLGKGGGVRGREN